MHAGVGRVRAAQRMLALPWAPSVLVAVCYFGAAKLGFLLASSTKQVTAVWPPTGIALVTMLLHGRATWPGVFVGAFSVNLLNDEPWLTALGIAVGNTVGPGVGAGLLNRVAEFDPRISRARDALALVLFGAVCGMSITATNGVLWLAVGGLVEWRRFFSVWWVWWVGDAMGVLLVAPLLLTWISQPKPRWTRRQLIELTVLFALLVLVSRVLFFSALPMTYGVFPFAMWAALRFGQREAASAVFVIAVCAVWGVIHQQGPFAIGSQEQRLIYLALFLGVMANTVLMFAGTSEERRKAVEALNGARNELESRVHQRTSELASVNSDLSRVNRELARKGQQLAAKNEELETFVYVVSHDLRAPLVNLHGFAEELRASCADLQKLLEASDLPALLRADIERIMREGIDDSLKYVTTSSVKLQRLIDALLVLSRTGREQYTLERLDVNAIARSTLDVLRQTIERSGARVNIADLPDAHGDLTAVGQVFSNLIGNALKYSQPGRAGVIEVGGELAEDMSHYWVRDNGVGIHHSAQKRMFQAFARFHPQLASGEGMGLAIVKRVVERHGGKVWADSQEGVGTTFHLTLPRAQRGEGYSWRRTA